MGAVQLALFYDVLLVIVTLVFVFACVKKGFIGVVAGLVAAIGGLVLWLLLAPPLASFVYDKIIEPPIVKAISENAREILPGDKLGKADLSKVVVGSIPLTEYISSLKPGSVVDISGIDASLAGLSLAQLKALGIDLTGKDLSNLSVKGFKVPKVPDNVQAAGENILADALSKASSAVGFVNTLCRGLPEWTREYAVGYAGLPKFASFVGNVVTGKADINEISAETARVLIRPAIILPLTALIFSLIFVIIGFVLHIVVKGFAIVGKIPVVGTANAVLGGVVGAAEAFAVLLAVSFALHAVILLTSNKMTFFNTPTIEATRVFKFVYGVFYSR